MKSVSYFRKLSSPEWFCFIRFSDFESDFHSVSNWTTLSKYWSVEIVKETNYSLHVTIMISSHKSPSVVVEKNKTFLLISIQHSKEPTMPTWSWFSKYYVQTLRLLTFFLPSCRCRVIAELSGFAIFFSSAPVLWWIEKENSKWFCFSSKFKLTYRAEPEMKMQYAGVKKGFITGNPFKAELKCHKCYVCILYTNNWEMKYGLELLFWL